MSLEVTHLGSKITERYPYTVRITFSDDRYVSQKDFDLLSDVRCWAEDIGLPCTFVGLSIYLPTMEEAEIVLLRWSGVVKNA